MLYNTKNLHGGDVYGEKIICDFSANINPFGTPASVTAAMQAALCDACRYPDPYCRELVRAVSEYESVPREYVLCGNGAAELIYSYCAALRPALVLELAPTLSEYSLAAVISGGEVRRFPLIKAKNFTLGEDFLTEIEKIRPNAVFLCSPNNPTGRLVSIEITGAILRLCRKIGARLFVDESFLELSGGRSAKGFLEIFVLKAFTKSFALAGVRLGYGLCSDAKLLEKMSRTVQPWNVSCIAQAAGTAALKEHDYLHKTREIVRTERVFLQEKLESLGFWVCPSEANFLMFQGKPGLCEALSERGVAIRDCENFPYLGQGWYRAAVRLRDENEMLVNTLSELCGKEVAWQKI